MASKASRVSREATHSRVEDTQACQDKARDKARARARVAATLEHQAVS